MKNTISFFPNSIAQIHLRKEKLFGLKDNQISLLLSPSLKIIKISNPKKVKFLYTQGDTLSTVDFSKWVFENDYDFSFNTKSKLLKRILIIEIDDVVDDLKENKSKTFFQKLIKWFKT